MHVHINTTFSQCVECVAEQCGEKMDSASKTQNQKKRKGGAERERIKRRKALEESAAKCCKITDVAHMLGTWLVVKNPSL